MSVLMASYSSIILTTGETCVLLVILLLSQYAPSTLVAHLLLIPVGLLGLHSFGTLDHGPVALP